MQKFKHYGLTILRLAILAANLPLPSMLHAQMTLFKLHKPTVQTPVESTAVLVSAKTAGVIRIGVALPTSSVDGKSDVNFAEPMREAERQMLSGVNVETVPLRSQSLSQAAEEAKLLDCDYVFTSTLTQQKTEHQSRFAKLGGMKTLHMATTAAQYVPVVKTTAIVATMALSTISQASTPTLASLDREVKAGSTVNLQYTLTDRKAVVVTSGTENAESKSDGDAVLTPMLTAAATRVMSSLKHEGGEKP